MSMERAIMDNLQRARLSRLKEARRQAKLNESWPPVLDRLSKYTKDDIRKYISNRLKIDIQNTPLTTTTISSNRDAQLRDPNSVLILHLRSANEYEIGKYETPIAVVAGGRILYAPGVYDRAESNWIEGSHMSWKSLLSMTHKVEKLVKADGTDLEDKRAQRADSRRGMVSRYVNKNDKRHAYQYYGYDKSGYVIDRDKYKKMLTNMRFENYNSVLDNAIKLYNEVASKINADMDRRQYDKFDTIMRGMTRYFGELKQSIKEYEGAKANDPDYDGHYEKRNVKQAIYELQDYMRDAKKFLSSF